MAASQNAQLNNWADTRVRTLADKLSQAYYALLAYETDYVADAIGALITADGAANLEGGQDSRIPITGTQVQNLKAGLDQLKIAWDTTLVGGVGTTVKTIMDAIQVNGSPR